MALASFPNEKEKKRLEALRKYEELYDGEHYALFGIKDYFVDGTKEQKKLYIAVNLPALISEYYADMVVADGIYVDTDDEVIQEAINEIYSANSLDVAFYESSITTSKSGFSVFRVRVDAFERVIIEEIPVDQYFPQSDGGVVLASYITLVSMMNGKKYKFLYKQSYSQATPTSNVILTHELWKVNNQKQPTERVAITEYMNIVSDTMDTGLPIMPVFQINNSKSSQSLFGKSDYKDPQPLFDEINNRITQISVQLIKHLRARIAVPSGTLDQDGAIKVSESDIFEVGDGDKMPQYITNSNPLIDAGFTQLDKLILLVSSITKIPAEEMGYPGKGGAEKPEAMRIKLFSTLRKVSRKRIYMEQVIIDMMNLALILKGINPPADKKKFDLRIKWTDALPTDENLLTDRLNSQVDGGLKSKRKAIKELQDIYDNDLDAEIAQIESENQPVIPSFNRPAQGPSPSSAEADQVATGSLNGQNNKLQSNDQ